MQKSSKPVHARNNAPLFQYGNPVLLQYDRYIAGLDTESVEMGGQALDTFQLLFKKQPAAVCDTAFYVFNQFQSKLSNYLNMHMEEDSIKYEDFIFSDENNKMPALSKKQKAVKQKLDKGAFGLGATEGEAYITQDQHLLLQLFAKYVTPVMKQYLAQLDKEQKEGFDEEGGLVIEPDQLADRTVWWEQFSQANPNFIYSKEAAKSYNLLLYVLMEGEGDNGARQYHYNDSDVVDTVSLSEYHKTAWTYMQKKHPQSQATAIVTPHLNAWLKNDTTEANKVNEDFLKSHKSPWLE